MGSVRITAQDETGTRLGRVRTRAVVDHLAATLPRPRRVLASYALVLVHEGAGRYIDDGVGERAVEAGDVIIVVPGHPHWYGPPRGSTWSEVFVVFDGPVFDGLAAGGVLDRRRPVKRIAPVEAWRARLVDFVTRPPWRHALERELEVLELAHLLVELDGGAIDPDPMPLPLRRARDALAADLTASLDLRDVAALAGMSYETFRKRFRSATGRAPTAFRLDRRVEAARALLRMTTMTHAAIAASLGFADEYHFAKRFRKRVGVSPRAYRRSV